MIKFLRKIRQNLLDEGKILKYLKYAIGEIILVVIGILIALQINTWNEQRIENAKEQALLKRLHNEFASNKEQLTGKMQIRAILIKSCSQLLLYCNSPINTREDSIAVHLSRLVPATFDPIQNDLVSSGGIELLKSEELKQLLINWSTDVIQLQEVEQMYLKFSQQIYKAYTTRVGIQRDIDYEFYNDSPISLLESERIKNPIPSKPIVNYKNLKSILVDPEFESIVSHSLALNMFNNQESVTLMKRIDAIMPILKKEIKEKG